MNEFVDSSAFFAMLDRRSEANPRAIAHLERLRASGINLLSHNYVLVETAALVTRRLGAPSAVDLLTSLASILDDVVWIDREIHESAVRSWLGTPSRSLSLVDLVSFEVMRRERIDTAFAFDADFARAGFRTVP